ncbi:MAG TPA: hypothetical protein VFW25_13635 [Silvibacterium sp.]|nr:hypothetical protein [Silvibacterium sp.]
MNADPLRRVGYSFLGLLAGNIALLIFSLLYSLRSGTLLYHQSSFPFWSQIKAFPVISIFSIVGWLIIGVPVVLTLPSDSIARLPKLVLLLIGIALGPLAISLIFVLLSRGQNIAAAVTATRPFWLYAAIVSTVAFAVHCLLLRRSMRSSKTAALVEDRSV